MIMIVDSTVKLISYNFQGNKLSGSDNISSYEEALEPIDSIWELANRIRVYLIEVMNLTAFGFSLLVNMVPRKSIHINAMTTTHKVEYSP